MAELRIRVLGPLDVLIDGVSVALGGHKQRSVLALLALRVNAPVSVDHLVDALWVNAPPANPVAVLQVYTANLRKALDPRRTAKTASTRLVSVPGGYRLHVDESECDVLTFQALHGQARRAAEDGDLPTARAALRAATALWRGAAFPDLADVPDLAAELSAWEERRLTAVEESLELDLALGQHGDVVAETEDLVARYPFRERIRAARVVGLYRAQRQVEALAACRAVREQFAEELGVDPGPELCELEEAVLRHDPLLTRSPPTGRSRAVGRVMNLPAPLSDFVGRLEVIDEVVELLSEGRTRLLTLTGPGGIGKTRLALEVAARCDHAYADGVCWVALDRITRPDDVLGALGDALDLPRHGGDDLSRVLAYLRTRRLLLLLDNFEHVMDAWPVVPQLLTAAPGLTVVVTSRSRLEVTGEQVVRVPPLELPALNSAPPRLALRRTEAVELFERRVRRVDRGWRVGEGDAGPMAALLHRLDGLPLAIELAAARAPGLDLMGLSTALDDALGLLTCGPRDVADRQRTLRGTIAWSYDLLPDDARRVFRALGVFAASPATDGIAAVLERRPDSDLQRDLDTLVRASLVQVHEDEIPHRFSLLRTVREFAVSLLSRQDLAMYRDRHARYVLELAEATAPVLHGAGQADAFRRLDAERAEIATAMEWTAGDDGEHHEAALRLVGALWHFWEISADVVRPRELAVHVLARTPDAPPRLRAPALAGAGTLSWLTGDLVMATQQHAAALEAYRHLEDPVGMAWATVCLATQSAQGGDWDEGRVRARQALVLAREADHSGSMCSALVVLGIIALYEGHLEAAARYQHEALDRARQAGDDWLVVKALVNLANVEETCGDYARAALHVRNALLISRRQGDRQSPVFQIEAMAALALRAERPRRAIRLFAAAATYRADKVQPLDDHERDLVEAMVAQARAAVGAVRFATLWAEGAALDLDAAVAEALSLGSLTRRSDAVLGIA